MDNLENSVFVVNNLTKGNLREFSANRVKNWTKLFHNLLKKENLDDFVDIFEIEKCLGVADEEQEKDTESDEFEANVDEDSSIDKDDSTLNMSAIEKNLTASNAQSVLAAIAENPNATGIVIEDREFLEKTLPFFETYNREIRKDGFEQLLDTFDERKIEKNIGKMLRPRINYDISPYNRRDNFLFGGGAQCMRGCNNTYTTDTDSDSVDEARYVRSTKRERYEMTTTTIKSFCSVKSRHDKLLRKYADNMPDRTMQDFKNCVKNCHVAGHKSWAGLHSCPQHSVERRIAHKSRNMPKRHQRFYGDSSLSSCSNLDEHKFLSYNGHFANRRKRALPFKCRKNGHCVDMSDSSPYHSNAYALQSYHSCYNDGLPFVRESECSCQGVNRLCNSARHLANSSSDDWLVENYDRSESTKATKETNETKTRKKRLQIEDQHSWLKNRNQQKAEEKSSSEDFTEKTESSQREVQLDKPEKSIKKTSKTNEKVKDKKNAANSNIKTKSRRGKTKPTNNDEIHKSLQKSFTDDSFERQLQLAIKASEDLYVEELKKKSNFKKSENTENNEPLRKATKKNVSFQEELKQVWNKKKSAANLSDISSESESKENTSREIKNNLENKKRNKRANVKAFSNLDFEENKNAAISAEGKQKIYEAFNKKKKLTKSKHHETSYSAKSKEFLKAKRSMHSNSIKDMSVDNETLKPNDHISSYSNLKLQKLHIGEDSSKHSTDANSSVVKMKLPNVTATSKSANNIIENTTFFSNSDQICNSTAIVSPIAKPRELLPKMKRANTAAALSTIVNSCELPSTSKAARNTNEMSQVLQRDLNSPATESSDRKQVTSTKTEKEKSMQKALKPHPKQKSPQIVLYTPQDTTLVPKSSFVNDKYRLTLQHLGSVIGQKYAKIFFRYYRGKCEFRLSSTVYYIPPKKGYYSGNDTSEDDIDIFDVPDIGKIVEEKVQ